MPTVVHWNPRTSLGTGRVLIRIRLGRRVDNFGDLLGPLITARLHEVLRLGRERSNAERLLTVGSILHLARDGDVVWGTGMHGKMLRDSAPLLDVRAVRGPLTAERLRSAGLAVPDVFGDPGLLVPHLWSDDELGIRRGTGGTVLVPNFHDRRRFPRDAVNPRTDVLSCVRAIASADRVVSSSLHGLVIAEAYGVPAVLVASSTEPTFKYEDYFRGTGRDLPKPVPTWRDGLEAAPAPPLEGWSPEPLLAAFPRDLWNAEGGAR